MILTTDRSCLVREWTHLTQARLESLLSETSDLQAKSCVGISWLAARLACKTSLVLAAMFPKCRQDCYSKGRMKSFLEKAEKRGGSGMGSGILKTLESPIPAVPEACYGFAIQIVCKIYPYSPNVFPFCLS